MSRPQTFRELQKFYCEEYRPLYDQFAATAHLPQELHAEIAAGFDHLMRNTVESTGSISANDCDRVAGHLKRATLDAFKLLYENGIREPYERLMDVRYIDVEDGKLQPRITAEWFKAQKIAECARSHEHLSDTADVGEWDAAFEEWKKILPIVDFFKAEASSDKILRVASRNRVQRIKAFLIQFFWTVFGTALGLLLPKCF